MSERVFTFPTYDLAQSILGQHNRYLQMMNEVIPADIVSMFFQFLNYIFIQPSARGMPKFNRGIKFFYVIIPESDR